MAIAINRTIQIGNQTIPGCYGLKFDAVKSFVPAVHSFLKISWTLDMTDDTINKAPDIVQ